MTSDKQEMEDRWHCKYADPGCTGKVEAGWPILCSTCAYDLLCEHYPTGEIMRLIKEQDEKKARGEKLWWEG